MSALVLALAVAMGSSAAPVGDSWITVDRDALIAFETGVEPALAPAASEISDPLDIQSDVIAVPMGEERILELAAFLHERYRRCGGFVRHLSREEAYEAAARAAGQRDLQEAPAPIPYTVDNGPVVNALVSQVSELEIRNTITALSAFFTRYHNCPSGQQSALSIRDKWQAYVPANRTDVSVTTFNHTGYTTLQPSVILTIQGATFPNEVVVLGGHQDSILGVEPDNCATDRAPGADDDASGIAVLSEIIRVSMQLGFRPERTVKFMAYAAEEVGLLGSQQIARQHQQQGVNVIGVLQFDMTNYSDTPNIDIVMIQDFTHHLQNLFVTELGHRYVSSDGVDRRTTSQCGYGCSDHASWMLNGAFPASFPFEARFGDHSPFIHTQNDTLAQSGGHAKRSVPFAKLGAAYMAELAKGALVPLAPAAAPKAEARPRARATARRSAR